MCKQNHFLKISDFSEGQISSLIDHALALKKMLKEGGSYLPLKGKTLAMIFQKPSNRTRLSFEVGMFQLGGHAIHIKDEEIGMGARESVEDVARVISRYADFALIRSFYHSDIEIFAQYAHIPVINGLSDKYHPCQALADMLTIKEYFGEFKGVRMLYIGDGNNVCHSLIDSCHVLGIDLAVCTPKGYEPIATKSQYQLIQDPEKAFKDRDVVYTDVWTSMGQEEESRKRRQDFKGYTVTHEAMQRAHKQAVFLHCLPAHRGEEVSHGVFESSQSKVFEQAENRLHAQKAILSYLGGSHVC